MKKVGAIILNWNGESDSREVLSDLEKTKTGDFQLEIILVDNASSEVPEFLKSYKSKKHSYVYLQNSKNLGFAGGNNVGIRYALDQGVDYILILNNDIGLEEDFLTELLKTFDSDSKMGAVSPKIYFAKGFEFQEKYRKSDLGKVIWYAGGDIDWDNIIGATMGVDEVDIGQYNNNRETDFATGTCLLTSAEVLSKVGLFDEKYFLYYEDTDLSVRIKKAGYKVVYAANSTISHKVAQSSGIGSGLNDYYTTRNRLIFGFKYAKMRTKFALFRESVRLLFGGRKWQRVGVRDFYLMNFGKGTYK